MAKAPADRFDSAAETCAQPCPPSTSSTMTPRPSSRVTRTPPEGSAPTFAQTERSWLVPVVVILLIALALGTVGVLFARNGDVRGFLNPSKGPAQNNPPAAVTLVSATAFDPLGDDHEHDGEAKNIIDGNPATSWRTETYANRRLGNRKQGVGIVVRLDAPSKLSRLEVSSDTHGYAADVFVADAPQPTFEAWGDAVDSKTNVDGDTTFDLKGIRGAAVLIWITDLGDANSTRIAEVRVVT